MNRKESIELGVDTFFASQGSITIEEGLEPIIEDVKQKIAGAKKRAVRLTLRSSLLVVCAYLLLFFSTTLWACIPERYVSISFIILGGMLLLASIWPAYLVLETKKLQAGIVKTRLSLSNILKEILANMTSASSVSNEGTGLSDMDKGVFRQRFLHNWKQTATYLETESLLLRTKSIFRTFFSIGLLLVLSQIIVGYAFVYMGTGILSGGEEFVALLQEPEKALYFSIVTFTTLGYGDYSPSPTSELIAGSEALLGYFLFALITALVFDAFFGDHELDYI